MRLIDIRIVAVGMGLIALTSCVGPSPQTVSAPPAAPVDMQALKGATPDVLDADFGAPALRRTDGTAQVWLYHSSVCGMDVFLYPDSAGTPRVAAVLPDSTNGPNCLASFAGGATALALQLPTRS